MKRGVEVEGRFNVWRLRGVNTCDGLWALGAAPAPIDEFDVHNVSPPEDSYRNRTKWRRLYRPLICFLIIPVTVVSWWVALPVRKTSSNLELQAKPVWFSSQFDLEVKRTETPTLPGRDAIVEAYLEGELTGDSWTAENIDRLSVGKGISGQIGIDLAFIDKRPIYGVRKVKFQGLGRNISTEGWVLIVGSKVFAIK